MASSNANEEKKEKLVKLYIPEIPDDTKNKYVILTANDVSRQLERGKEHMVPECIALEYKRQQKMVRARREKIEKLKAEEEARRRETGQKF